MIKAARTIMAILSLVLLSLGYAASQFAYPERAAEYAKWIDQPWARWLSLAMLLIAMVLCFVPDGAEEVDEP
jgi:hypothetical protein